MVRRRSTMVVALTATAATLALSGCGYEGLNSYTLPGTKGTGSDSIEIKAEFQNMGNLVENQPVLVNDINVGTITDIELNDWTPVATMSIKDDVALPANAVATIGQTSLLGAKHIELAPPSGVAPEGRLQDGALIPLAQTHNAPETEDVLASVSLLLNGGGLQHIDTIARELNRAMGGRTQDYQALFTELNTFMGGLDDQKGDIIHAVESLNRLAGNLNNGMPQIEAALDKAPQALDTLYGEIEPLSQMIDSFAEGWGSREPAMLDFANKLDQVLKGMEPFAVSLADAGTSIVDSLRAICCVAFVFDGAAAAFAGDSLVLEQAMVDLTLPTLDRAYLTGTPLAGVLSDANKFLKVFAGQAGNPLTSPLQGAGPPALADVTSAPSQLLGGLLGGLGGGN